MSSGVIHRKFYQHPKVRKLGWAARGVFMTVLSWCADKLTDGRVSKKAVNDVLGCPPGALRELVEKGFFLPAEDGNGWVVKDYHQYAPSKSEVEAELEAVRRRVAKHRAAKASKVDESDVCNAFQEEPKLTEAAPSAAAKAAERSLGVVVNLAEPREAEAVGSNWFTTLTTRQLDFVSWRSDFYRIGQKPEHERALVAQHWNETPYIKERPTGFNPDHALKYWDDFVAGPRLLGMKPPVPSRGFNPERVSAADEFARMEDPEWLAVK
jgi:hypothetical protein